MCRNSNNAPISRTSAIAAILAVAGLAWTSAAQVNAPSSLVRARVSTSNMDTTALTYQGQLYFAGAPFNGVTTIRFTMFDAPTGGRQIGQTLELAGAAVSNGMITCDLPFSQADLAAPRFIELSVKVGDKFHVITPRHATPAQTSVISNAQGSPTSGSAGAPSELAPLTSGSPDAPTPASPGATINGSANPTPPTGGNPEVPGQWSASGSVIFYNDGAVGIGTAAPANGLFETVASSGNAIAGTSTGAGIVGGVYGTATAPGGRGVWGFVSATTGFPSGVFGHAVAPTGRGVVGRNTGTSGQAYGGYFDSSSPAGIGAYGEATDTSGATSYGLFGLSRGLTGVGVFGEATNNTATTNYGVWGVSRGVFGRGVYGQSTNGSGFAYGVYGFSPSPNGRGVFGGTGATSGSTVGVFGNTQSSSGIGVMGNSVSATGTTFGVQGRVVSPTGRGVYGEAISTSGLNYGGYFFTNSIAGTGVLGSATASTGSPIGGDFVSGGPTGVGAQGRATSSSGANTGVYGLTDSTVGMGVFGEALAGTGVNYGVVGTEASSDVNAFAVFAMGDVGASGTKPFRIDHPADPANMYLYHYAAESDEVINFYSGTIQLDAAGEAIVTLPSYFNLINIAPRYQLTAVGAPMPMLHVADKVSGGDNAASFRIAGGAPGGEVSWEVKAQRNDPYVQQRGAPVEVPKTGIEKGRYQHPELYGKPMELRTLRLPLAPAVHQPAPVVATESEAHGQN